MKKTRNEMFDKIRGVIVKNLPPCTGISDRFVFELMEALTEKKTANIEVPGHKGTWYIIGAQEMIGETFFLLEHEEHGDEAPSVIVDKDFKEVCYPVHEGFTELVHLWELDRGTRLEGRNGQWIPIERKKIDGKSYLRLRSKEMGLQVDDVITDSQFNEIEKWIFSFEGLESYFDNKKLREDFKIVAEGTDGDVEYWTKHTLVEYTPGFPKNTKEAKDLLSRGLHLLGRGQGVLGYDEGQVGPGEEFARKPHITFTKYYAIIDQSGGMNI